ncbi:MAG: transposase [Thaumarchaeota archaeon]|nr:transposase [Nitrososphaerota archaeon]
MMDPACTPHMKTDRLAKAVSRFHRGNLGPASDGISGVFRHVQYVAETAALVSRQTGITDTFEMTSLMYEYVVSSRVSAAVTQAAIKTGVAAMKARPDAEPEFKTPTIKLNNQCWRLNPVAGGYVATGNIGSRERPIRVVVGVPKDVGARVSEHRPGELTITPEKYAISYTKEVEVMPDRDPERGSKHDIIEIISGVDRVAGSPQNVLGIDINATNVTITDNTTTVQIDTSGDVERVLGAKTRQVGALKRDDAKWEEKRGRSITRDREHAKEDTRRVMCGGPKKYNKLKRDSKAAERRRDEKKVDIARQEKESLTAPRKEWRDKIRESKDDPERQNKVKVERDTVTKAAKAETRRLKREADDKCKQKQARLRGEMERCVVPQNAKTGASPLQKTAANHSKMREVVRASRRLENTMHVVSLFVVSWAIATNGIIALENLRNMPRGWMRSNKRFGRGMRRKLYSACMLKMSDMIGYKARWNGAGALYMNPYHTSKLCSICRDMLEGGDYHLRYCRRCNVCVNRDVNASDNVRRTTAAALYGAMVLASPGEAMRSAVKKLCYADLRTDGMTIMADGKVVWVGR